VRPLLVSIAVAALCAPAAAHKPVDVVVVGAGMADLHGLGLGAKPHASRRIAPHHSSQIRDGDGDRDVQIEKRPQRDLKSPEQVSRSGHNWSR
jgi:hypothetical protein